MSSIIYWTLLILLSFNTCKTVQDVEIGEEDADKDKWLIEENKVLDGGPGKDGIPELTNPGFITVEEATYLKDNDLVIGFVSGVEILAYPHAILNWHEIINDDVNDISLAITYCPLTGTGIGWNRNLDGNTTTFG